MTTVVNKYFVLNMQRSPETDFEYRAFPPEEVAAGLGLGLEWSRLTLDVLAKEARASHDLSPLRESARCIIAWLEEFLVRT